MDGVAMKNINITPEFVLSGNAIFTVSNTEGKHHTFNVEKSKPNERYPQNYFGRVLVGPDNNNPDEYRYVGMLHISPNPNIDPKLVTTKASKLVDPVVFKLLQWTLKVVWQVARGAYTLPERITIQHEGRCGRCGAKLTNPASLDTGLGPECAERVGVPWRERTQQEELPIHTDTIVEKIRKRRAKAAKSGVHIIDRGTTNSELQAARADLVGFLTKRL
jgi:hypothetical protein